MNFHKRGIVGKVAASVTVVNSAALKKNSWKSRNVRKEARGKESNGKSVGKGQDSKGWGSNRQETHAHKATGYVDQKASVVWLALME